MAGRGRSGPAIEPGLNAERSAFEGWPRGLAGASCRRLRSVRSGRVLRRRGAGAFGYHAGMAEPLEYTPLDKLTYQSILEFCAEQRPEGVRLDYKREFPRGDPAELARHICAFANTQGGMVILRVDHDTADKARRRPEKSPRGAALGHEAPTRILQSCRRRIDPPVHFEVSDFLAPSNGESDRGFIVIRVLRSDVPPHELIDRERGIYVRIHDMSEPVHAGAAELQRMLDRRRRAIDLQDARRAALIRRAAKSARGSHNAYLAVAVGPTIGNDPPPTVAALANQAELRRKYEETTVADGVVWLKSQNSAVAADIFGNAVATANRTRLAEAHTVTPKSLPSWHRFWDAFRIQEANIDKIEALELAAIIVEAFRIHGMFSNPAGGLGRCRVQVRAVGLADLLVNSQEGWLAGSHTGEDVEFTFDTSCPDWGGPFNHAAIEAMDRLIWDWGRLQRVDFAGFLIDQAEQRFFDNEQCACNRCRRPRNRESCYECRKQANAAAT